MSFNRELVQLRETTPELVQELLDSGAGYIAGGAIASIFSGQQIRDLDVFFRSQSDADDAAKKLEQAEKVSAIIKSDAAVSAVLDGTRVQMIRAVFGDPAAVIEKFDFTICQAYYSKVEGFVFGAEFLQHLAQRRLVFNLRAEYPICSLYRARKFIARGFHFSGLEAIKLGLRIQALQIATYAELRKQLMGIDTLFLAPVTDSLLEKQDQKYDMEEFVAMMEEQLERLSLLTGDVA